jgi:hypothetical protein
VPSAASIAPFDTAIEPAATLHLAEPCSARQLSERHGNGLQWTTAVADSTQHAGMASAPHLARSVAEAMMRAAPNLGSTMVTLDGEGEGCGEVIVIANPGPDPRGACLKALAILVCHNNDAVCGSANWGKNVERGMTFNLDPNDPWLTDSRNPEPFAAGKQDAGLLAVTNVMAEQLTEGFQFCFLNHVVASPMIYGGYANDGSVVGVLCRAACFTESS